MRLGASPRLGPTSAPHGLAVARYLTEGSATSGGPWAPSLRSALWVHDRIPVVPYELPRHRDKPVRGNPGVYRDLD